MNKHDYQKFRESTTGTFTKEKAAQYFVVAWVKDWRFDTYLKSIGASRAEYTELHGIYPWLPPPDKVDFYFKNQLIRAWAAMSMVQINDKLWDAKSSSEKLELAKKIERFVSDKVVVRHSHKKALQERRMERNTNQASAMAHKLSVEIMRKGSGHHWNVVK